MTRRAGIVHYRLPDLESGLDRELGGMGEGCGCGFGGGLEGRVLEMQRLAFVDGWWVRWEWRR
jgi:hypothetical protein